MKRLVLIAATIALGVSPAMAQNASQISNAQKGASCPQCNLFQATLSNLTLTGRNFSRARLRQADLSLSLLNQANLSGADLRDADAFGAVMTGADLRRANLTNASFVGAHLEGARFDRAILSGVNFSGAEMRTVKGLTQTQLSSACGDESTRLPAGLRLKSC
jgi:uncharacterized protein YjbI with pentapeptide repeats